jgi:RNA polymerase sigma factor (sigma-70 family)
MTASLHSTRPAAPRTGDDLLAGVCRGSATAWAEVVARYRGLVRARIASFRLQPCDAADAEQATWMRLAEHAHRIHTADALPGWLAVVARRECLAILRRGAAGPVLAHDAAVERVDPAAPVEEQVLDRVEARAVWLAVERLPARQRDLVHALFGAAPLPYEEIVARMGIPAGSIGPTRARALGRLRRALTDGNVDAGDVLDGSRCA